MLEAQLCGFAVSFGTTVQAFSNTGPVQKSSVFCGLGCVRAAVLLLISVLALTKKAEISNSFLLSLVEAFGVYGVASHN